MQHLKPCSKHENLKKHGCLCRTYTIPPSADIPEWEEKPHKAPPCTKSCRQYMAAERRGRVSRRESRPGYIIPASHKHKTTNNIKWTQQAVVIHTYTYMRVWIYVCMWVYTKNKDEDMIGGLEESVGKGNAVEIM